MGCEEAIRRAYAILDSTPQRFDCGKLCDKKCCKGDENDGMQLFPGEEKVLAEAKGIKICASEGNEGYPVAVCEGRCDRSTRPLSCRIFPYFPVLLKRGTKVAVKIGYDPRAVNMCPLVKMGIPATNRFVEDVREAIMELAKEPEIKRYIEKRCRYMDEIANLSRLLTGKRRTLR